MYSVRSHFCRKEHNIIALSPKTARYGSWTMALSRRRLPLRLRSFGQFFDIASSSGKRWRHQTPTIYITSSKQPLSQSSISLHFTSLHIHILQTSSSNIFQTSFTQINIYIHILILHHARFHHSCSSRSICAGLCLHSPCRVQPRSFKQCRHLLG